MRMLHDIVQSLGRFEMPTMDSIRDLNQARSLPRRIEHEVPFTCAASVQEGHRRVLHGPHICSLASAAQESSMPRNAGGLMRDGSNLRIWHARRWTAKKGRSLQDSCTGRNGGGLRTLDPPTAFTKGEGVRTSTNIFCLQFLHSMRYIWTESLRNTHEVRLVTSSIDTG